MKFEYYTTTCGSTLNELGQEGWELVAVVQHEMSFPVFYMKRTIEEKDEI